MAVRIDIAERQSLELAEGRNPQILYNVICNVIGQDCHAPLRNSSDSQYQAHPYEDAAENSKINPSPAGNSVDCTPGKYRYIQS